ncbi:hypothetical protein [Streptomyces olivochromogenes]|uniref:Uncharacterized protein n=1 Tax=Streptomyces olivochromogenes TaxID=1963 RepID=A0A250VT20_STROL|nr:hypothetical protein [Streptomyces olivochromogenes]KUN38186.1 hypothetical protein AQJ27_44590 [Streptomyces olivochromogenes]GAX57239.1 hypothetical protein SO3561_08809 [Streptomyces olivochromogenes]
MEQNLADRSTELNARIEQVKSELDEAKRQLTAIEALLCHCQPEREHDDNSPARYMHAADCIVTASQQAANSQ